MDYQRIKQINTKIDRYKSKTLLKKVKKKKQNKNVLMNLFLFLLLI